MRLAIVTTRFIQGDMRGGEEVIRLLANNLKDRYKIHLITSNMMRESYSYDLSGHFKSQQIKVIDGNLEISRLKTYFLTQKMLQILNKILFQSVLRKLRVSELVNTFAWGPLIPDVFNIVFKGEYDVVHSSIFPTATAYMAFKASLDSHKPFVFTPYYHFMLPSFKNSALLQHIVKNSTALIACTSLERKELLKLGANPDDTFVVPLSFDTSVIPNDLIAYEKLRERMNLEEYFVILTHPWNDKGGVQILRSVAILHNMGFKIALVSIGKPDNQYLDERQKIFSKYPSIRVHDFGWVEGKTKWELFSLCDVFALPSRSDAFGLSYLNAWAFAKPILAAVHTPISEIIDEGVDGILVNPDRIEDIVSGLMWLYKSNPLSLGRNGYAKLLTEYSPKKMSDKYSEVFEFAMSKG